MKRLLRILRAESFRGLVFVFSLLLLLWPFLPNKALLPYYILLKYFFLLWAAVIVLLFAIAMSLQSSSEGKTREDD